MTVFFPSLSTSCKNHLVRITRASCDTISFLFAFFSYTLPGKNHRNPEKFNFFYHTLNPSSRLLFPLHKHTGTRKYICIHILYMYMFICFSLTLPRVPVTLSTRIYQYSGKGKALTSKHEPFNQLKKHSRRP